MSDINGGQYPNPNGSPIFPGTVVTGPIIAGNILHSDGSGTLAALGETGSGTANTGYAQMVQSAAGLTFASAVLNTTSIVIPAQSQITDIYFMVTTAQGSAATLSIGTSAGTATSLVAAGSATLATLGQYTLLPTTSTEIGNWDNVGTTDIQVTVTVSGTGTVVGTLTVFYVQGINLAS